MKFRYLNALEKRGYRIKIGPNGGLLLPENMTEPLKTKCRAAKEEILSELRMAEVLGLFGGVLSSDTSDYPSDPRPDLPADHDAWERLLSLSADIPIYPTLHYFRCCGAHLRRSCNQWGLWRGEMDEVEYTRVRRTLQPTDDIIARAQNPLTIQLGRL